MELMSFGFCLVNRVLSKASTRKKIDRKAFKIEDEGLQLQNQLEQKRAAKECAEWDKKKGTDSVNQSIESVTWKNVPYCS